MKLYKTKVTKKDNRKIKNDTALKEDILRDCTYQKKYIKAPIRNDMRRNVKDLLEAAKC